MNADPALCGRIALVAHGLARQFDAGDLRRDKGETVRSDARARLCDEAVADLDVGPDAHGFAQVRLRPQHGACADIAERPDGRSVADARTRPDHCHRPHRDVLAQLGRGVHHGGRVDPFAKALAGVHQGGDAGHGHTGARRVRQS